MLNSKETDSALFTIFATNFCIYFILYQYLCFDTNLLTSKSRWPMNAYISSENWTFVVHILNFLLKIMIKRGCFGLRARLHMRNPFCHVHALLIGISNKRRLYSFFAFSQRLRLGGELLLK